MQEPEICLESYSFKQLFRLLWASQNHQYICKFQLIPALNSCARILVILKTQSNRKLAYKFSTLDLYLLMFLQTEIHSKSKVGEARLCVTDFINAYQRRLAELMVQLKGGEASLCHRLLRGSVVKYLFLSVTTNSPNIYKCSQY